METTSQHLVILLHGIARSSRSMRSIANTLTKLNYLVVNIDYPSRTNHVDVLSEGVYQQLLSIPDMENKTIHFVTHSMGALILRALLANYSLLNVQRVVMLGPPNQGSEVADWVQRFYPIKAFYGPALTDLTIARALSHPFPVLPKHCQVGIIAGNVNIDPICHFLLPAPHDGKVTVRSTQIAGMTDHIELPTTHSFMMFNKQVIAEVTHFLTHGYFFRAENSVSDTHVK